MSSVEPTRTGGAWGIDDLLRLGATLGIGALVIAVAWHEAADEVQLDDQVRWANLSAGGLMVASFGMVSWLLRGRRAVGARRRHLLGEPAMAMTSESIGAEAPALVAAKGRRFFHRADCALVVGRKVTAAGVDAHRAAGRTPCGVCRP